MKKNTVKKKSYVGRATAAVLLVGAALSSAAFACSDPNGNCAAFEATTCVGRQNVAPGDDWLRPSEQRTIVVTMENTGTSTWSHGTHRIGTINPYNNTTWGDARGDLDFGVTVAPGEYGKFYVDLEAPAIVGNYDFEWQMVSVNDTPKWFGDIVDLGAVPVSNDAEPTIPAGHYTVIVAAGQSNMTGAGTLASELPDDAFDVDILNTYWNSNVDKCRWSGITENGTRFGADWPFARALAKLGKESLHDIGVDGPIAVIKYSRGGSNLYEDWEKGNTAGYGLYDDMVDFVNERLAELGQAATYEMGAFLWVQGEGDVGAAEDYGDNLTALFQDVQTDLGIDHFLLSRLHGDTPGHAALRADQVGFADATAGAEWVDTDDLTLPDTIHFDSESQRAIGLRMGVAYLRSLWELNP